MIKTLHLLPSLRALILNRIEKQLVENKNNNIKSLVAYLVAGDPNMDDTLSLMHGFVDAGVDVIEVGVPFSDPIAEGPIIQSAHDRSLANKTSFEGIIDLISNFRKKNTNTPIVLMGYLNSFLKNQKAFSRFDDIGIDGVLIVDAPGEYSLKDLGISNANVVSISLVSPTTTKERTKKICNASSGFIYYVTLKGVTGSSNVDLEEIKSNVIDLQKNTDLPVMAGFGIKNKEQAESISKVADGVVIGSYLVESIFQAKKTTEYKKIYNYLSEIKSVINK